MGPVVRSLLWGAVTAAAGCLAAALTGRVLLARRVRRWAREALVPEVERANVSLPSFLAVVDDLPDSRMFVMDPLWPVKDQLPTIRKVLAADEKL